MKVHDIPLRDGRVAAFEVDNLRLSRRRLCKIVERIPGARLVRRPRLFSWFVEDVFCVFEVGGVCFEAQEPYGDNSRYWVGPAGTGANGKLLEYHVELERVREAFSQA